MLRIDAARYLYRIPSRNRYHLGECALKTGDPVLGILGTLMGVACRAILAQYLPVPTGTVDPLVDKNSIALSKIRDIWADLDNLTAELVSKYLRYDRERYRLATLICVIVCMSAIDVKIGAAQTDRIDSHQDVVRARLRRLDVANFELLAII